MMTKNNKPSGAKLLAMDTATSSMTVAILEGGTLRKEINSHAERNHSLYLLPHVQEALGELGWSPKDLQGIAVGRGPGSYTGVRIGVTVAKTMAWALGLPVIGVSSLEAMAAGGYETWVKAAPDRQTGHAEGSSIVWLVPLMNARRGQVYTSLHEAAPAKRPFGGDGHVGDAIYKGTNLTINSIDEFGEGSDGLTEPYPAGLTRLQDDGIRLFEQWADRLLERIKGLKSGGEEAVSIGDEAPSTVLFIGETGDFPETIERFRKEAAVFGVQADALPYDLQGRYIGLIGQEMLKRGATSDVHGLLPNYTQLAEAEVNLLNKGKSATR